MQQNAAVAGYTLAVTWLTWSLGEVTGRRREGHELGKQTDLLGLRPGHVQLSGLEPVTQPVCT